MYLILYLDGNKTNFVTLKEGNYLKIYCIVTKAFNISGRGGGITIR